MNCKTNIVIALLLFLTGQSMYGQKGVEAGAWAGGAVYFGDLNNLYRVSEPGFSGGITFRYNFNTRLSARAQINYFRLRGSDAKSNNGFDKRRNLNFFSDVYEFAPALEFNFFTLKHGSKDNYATPYMYAGFSVFHYNPKTTYQDKTYALRELGTEGQLLGDEYNPISSSWLFGGGMKFDLSYRWSLNMDIGYRSTGTDYLDDVSKIYPNYTELEAVRGKMAVILADRSLPDLNQQKIGATGFQRGDSKDHDAFLSLGINLIYFFGRLNCPSLSEPEY